MKMSEIKKQMDDAKQREYKDLYETYYRRAYVVARQIINQHEECEDIVQESFLRCFSKMQDGVEILGFGAYIETIAKNIAKDHIKAREAKKRPDEILSSFQTEMDDGEMDLIEAQRSEIQNAIIKAGEFYQTPEELLEQKELQEIVAEILDELPDYQQEALSLYYLEGMKCREIAELYQVPVETIKSRVKQGKKKVEKKVLLFEETKGIRLHGLSGVALFLFLFRQRVSAQAATIAILPAAGYAGVSAATHAAQTAAIAGKAVSTKVLGIAIAGVLSVGVIAGAGVGIYRSFNKESGTTQSQPADSKKQEDTRESDTDNTADLNDATQNTESEVLAAPEFIEVEEDVYHKYWEQHRQELIDAGSIEGDGDAVLISWPDVPNADGFEVTTVWANEEGGENPHVYEIEKTGNGTYKSADGVYKDAYDLITYQLSMEVPYTDRLQFVDPCYGWKLLSVSIKSYRMNGEQKIWSEEVTR